ncbi:hypothetical protein AACH06_27640 [Ideonella sp. DXS29W]|uniref:Uncharacterized protein n=1 Tax=Ideonella lacteola TaxID=2984193 RepID=A0ABU9BXM6_9BURK
MASLKMWRSGDEINAALSHRLDDLVKTLYSAVFIELPPMSAVNLLIAPALLNPLPATAAAEAALSRGAHALAGDAARADMLLATHPGSTVD